MAHHLAIPGWFGRWVLAHRTTVLIIILGVTGVTGWFASRAPFRTSMIQGFMADQSRYDRYRDRAAQFGGGTDDLLYFATEEGEELFTAPRLNAIRAAAAALRAHPKIADVICLTDLPRVVPAALGLRAIVARSLLRRRILKGDFDPAEFRDTQPPLYWPVEQEEQQQVLPELREQMLQDDLIRGVLLARDGRGQAMVLRVDPEADVDGYAQIQLRKDIENLLLEHGLGSQGLHSAGVLIIQGRMLEESLRSLAFLFPLGAAIVAVLVYRVFGRLSVVGLTLLIAAVAIVWAVGAAAIAFEQISLLVAGVPLLVLVISTADTVHLSSAYCTEVSHGVPSRAALLKVVQDVGGACVLTSITTGIGFLSLMVVPAATIQHVSLAASVGVAGALLLALTLGPVILSYFPPPKAVHSANEPWINQGIHLMVAGCKWLALRHPRLVLAASAVVLLISLGGLLQIRADADLAARFPKNHPMQLSERYFAAQLMGVQTIEVYLETAPGRLTEPAVIAAIARFQQRVEALPEVESVDSLITLLNLSRKALGVSADEELDQVANDGLLKFVAAVSQDKSRAVVDREQGLSRIAVRLSVSRIFEILEVADEKIARLAREELPPDVAFEVSGGYPILARAALTVIDNQKKGFVICFLCVMLSIVIGLRSLKLSLLAVFPNLLPLCLLGGLLGLTSDIIDTDVLGVAVVSFGLAVDDTIHFVHRFDIELGRAQSVRVALDRTYAYTGTAIMQTTVILSLGLLPFAMSNYLSLRMLGTYLVFVLGCAVIGDLLLLPSLILLYWRDGKTPSPTADAAGSPDAAPPDAGPSL